MPTSSPITRRLIVQKAWPIILANAAVPLLGLADTAIIGNLGSVYDLGAIALGALLFNFIYWSFGFLRMGTTGFVAQAAGAGQEQEVRTSFARSLVIGAILGAALILLQNPIAQLAFQALQGSAEVESITRDYFAIRIWGAPATLGIFTLLGILIGLGESRRLLLVQVLLNGLNIALDCLFAGYFHMGAKGIALGTALAEWTTLLLAGALVINLLRQRHTDSHRFFHWPDILNTEKLKHTLSANGDILIRTLALLFAFYWFTNQSAQFGDAILGANHILLQLVSFSAFFLDGFAFVAESMVGKAIGAKSKQTFVRAIRLTSELAAMTAVLLALGIFVSGPLIISSLTNLAPVSEVALDYLPLACAYILLSVGAFQLDGVFIGATRTREMRNASLASLLAFLAVCIPAALYWGNQGLWIAFVFYVVMRAVCLFYYLPGINRSFSS